MKHSKFRKMFRQEYRFFLIFSGIALLGFSLFYIYPIIRTLMLSFTNKTIFDPTVEYVGLENYIYALTNDPLFHQSMIQSLIFAFASGVMVLVTSLLLAVLLNSKVKFIGIFRTIYFIPFIIPSFAVGAVYKNLFNPNTGLINQILEWFGVVDPPLWYIAPSSALITMIVISSFGFGVKMLVFLAALQGIDPALYEVAQMEGASKWRSFRFITLPLISPMLFFNIILITIDGLKAFSLAFVMGNGQGWPSNSTLLFPIYMFMTAFNMPFRLGYAAAMAWLFFLMILGLTGVNFLASRFYVEKDVT
ncbi:MAG: sugar ABC transporter permease [Candidatus Izemoplasmatales bacterium]|jgi:ABC-type sugar transport system permease subunit|nr:sugar ABC transporter permease [bacterium]MDZ4196811.1 sugar ABC transporter permease [Candidatus Izemoplasmatales bacterium]